ncbi:hypothetical protein JZ785_11270 [Alicyclobacillus curvatus]|nr:hypothetical protein JZ785_11270 [Alicyclobacillus curvatus]
MGDLMKLLAAVLTFVFGVYSGIQSYRIAAAGAAQQIPQLQGDGGGGLVFALVCVIAAVVVLKRPSIGVWLLSGAAVIAGFVGLSFGDPSMYWWAIAALALAVLDFVIHRMLKSTKHRYGTATRKQNPTA